MPVYFYKTINKVAQSEFLEKRSRFISYIYPINTEEEALHIIKDISNQYYDARHICRAYRLGFGENIIEKSSDDGEPSGTAGKPILGRIISSGLTNVLILVIRYFGGIKLGPSGLIAAYRKGAEAAIGEAEIVNKIISKKLLIELDYDTLGSIMRISKEYQAEIIHQQLTEKCKILVEIASQELNNYIKRIESISYKIKINIVE